MRGPNLLSLNHQIVLRLVSEVDLYLIKINLLSRIGIHLSNMGWVKVLNAANVNICHVQEIALNTVRLRFWNTWWPLGRQGSSSRVWAGSLLSCRILLFKWLCLVKAAASSLYKITHSLHLALVKGRSHWLSVALKLEEPGATTGSRGLLSWLASCSVIHRGMPSALVSLRV